MGNEMPGGSLRRAVVFVCALWLPLILSRSSAPTHVGYVLSAVASGGTLIAVVPFGAGVVVAADSRETISGFYCDQRAKLRLPDTVDNLVLTVTGQSRWYDLTALVGDGRNVTQSELCRFASTAPMIFDMESVVVDWLRSTGLKSPKDLQLDQLAAYCVERLTAFKARYSNLMNYPDPNGLMNVVLVSYEVGTSRETIVKDFRIKQSTSGDFFYGGIDTNRYGATSPSSFRLFGEADKFAKFAWPTFRSQPLKQETRSLLARQILTQDTTLSQAEAFAIDLIEVGSANANLNTAQEGVGGPARAISIGLDARPQILR